MSYESGGISAWRKHGGATRKMVSIGENISSSGNVGNEVAMATWQWHHEIENLANRKC